MNTLLQEDKHRYPNAKIPTFQKIWRKAQKKGISRLVYKPLFVLLRELKCIDMSVDTNIGGGFYIGHGSCFTINSHAVIGRNCSIHKGALIGRENRGKRKGVPTIGDEVWIGINAVIVGNITIGNDVLIAPNAYVNFDVPAHSIVVGNPGVVKHCEYATEGYINNKVTTETIQ